MKCQQCGVEIEEGKMYCSSCGQEVQIVPDFEPEVENTINQAMDHILKDVFRKDNIKTVKRKVRKKHFFRWMILLIVLSFSVLLLVWGYMNNAVDYQIRRADYYMKQQNGQIHINRINNFKEFLDEEEPISPKKRIIEIINNLTLENTTSKNETDDNVQFMTIHQAKGLEFPIVILPGFEEGIIPSHQAKTVLEIEEERRICYVGVSRAKDNCIIMTNEKRFLYGREQRQKESRFLLEILGKNNPNN